MLNENDIYRDWKAARDPKSQISILAQLNAVKEEQIREVLIAECERRGEPVPPYLRIAGGSPKNRTGITYADLQRLVDEGKTDKEIAQFYGCSITTVRNKLKSFGIIRDTVSESPKSTTESAAQSNGDTKINGDNASEASAADIVKAVAELIAKAGRRAAKISLAADRTVGTYSISIELQDTASEQVAGYDNARQIIADEVSQFLQDAGFEEASKAVDCEFEL